jgi:gliding motility-associated-like protein
MPVALYAQGPSVWVFGRNAGLNFNSGQPVATTHGIDNCYSPSSSQCDAAGNLLFYCDGRNIKDRNGQIMPGSLNPVWPDPVHIARKIISNIIPVVNDPNRYYVFMLSPSSGNPPYGTYYSGALTYSIVDMQLNNGNGGIDPSFSNILINTELNIDMIAVPGKDCSYWLLAYKATNVTAGNFVAYKISEQGIEAPVYSSLNVPGYQYSFSDIRMIYAYQYRKIIASAWGKVLTIQDFDNTTGIVSNSKMILDLVEFRNAGGGLAPPSFCLSDNERFLYLLGYPHSGVDPNTPSIRLRQYPIDLGDPNLILTTSNIIFETSDPIYQVPATSLPYISQTCDIRRGPDTKVYMFFNTGMSFMGQINKPDLAGTACDFSAQGVQLLPNTFGSYFFPAIENKRFDKKQNHVTHDTLLCLTTSLMLKPGINEGGQYSFLWNDGTTAATKTVYGPGTYWVRSTGDCLQPTQVDTFIIRSEKADKCNCKMFLPNAFSPNDDGINDLFKPILPTTCLNGGYSFSIYNRWGAAVYRGYDILKGWDGTINNKYADVGVYHYTIHYNDVKNESVYYKGSFTLLR